MNIFQKFLIKFLPKELPSKQMNGELDQSIMYTKIAFDASVMRNKNLGIGMYDMTNNVRLCEGGKLPKMCSTMGEAEALKFTLNYAKEKGFKNLALFTDSQNLSRHDLEDYTKDYDFEDVVLTWVPRELNKEADKMSKAGQELNKNVVFEMLNIIYPAAANTTTVKSNKSKTAKTGLRIVKKKQKTQRSFKTMFGNKYSYNQKARFIMRLAENHNEREFGRFLIDGVKDIYDFQPGNKMAPLMRMAKTIMEYDDMPVYVRRRFKKFKMDNGQKMDRLSFENFEKEFDRRKVQALKKVKFAEAKKTPVMTPFMEEMVENIRKAA